MDTISQEKRSWNMSRIKAKNTLPEIKVRQALKELGKKYKLHVKNLSGKPDIVINNDKVVYFINGCFWHQHKGCKRKSMPKNNIEYWSKKLYNNSIRQKNNINDIRKKGFRVKILWECEVKNKDKLIKKLII